MNLPTETKIFDPTTRKVAQMKLRYRRKQKCTLRYWKEDEMIPWWRMWWINNLLWLLKICLHYCLAIFPVFMKTDSHTQNTQIGTHRQKETHPHIEPHALIETETHTSRHTHTHIDTTTHKDGYPQPHTPTANQKHTDTQYSPLPNCWGRVNNKIYWGQFRIFEGK